MTTLPTAGYISDSARTNAEQKTAFENIVSGMKELLGGAGKSSATLSGDAFTPANNAAWYVLTGQGSAADDLASIGATNLRNGQIIAIQCADAANPITVKANTAGTGHIKTRDGVDYVLNDTKDIMFLAYNTTSPTYFEEIHCFTDRLRMFGRALPSSKTIASDKITPTQWMHSLIGEGATTDNLSEMVPTWIPKGHLVAIIGNDSYTITLKHNTGTNKFIHADAADIALTSSKQTVIYQLNSDGATWREFCRSGFTTTFYPKFPPSAKSADFTANGNSGTLYQITASGAIAVTLPASPADGTVYYFKIVSGSGLVTFTANGAETIDLHTSSATTATMQGAEVGIMGLVAVTGGWQAI